jgi:hypothetical protein
MFKPGYLLLFLFLCPLLTFSQQKQVINAETTSSISGIVRDKDNKTMPGVIVFLSGSKKITATNSDGEFNLSGISPGTYQLVAKMIGYQSFTKTILVEQQSLIYKIQLFENDKLLNEVVVTSGVYRPEYLKTFIKHFIGESADASKCRILNPGVLNFHYNHHDNLLTANADDFLVIENKGLGYRLKYLLTRFEYNDKTTRLFYSGVPCFEEMPGSNSDKKRWAKNREIAYKGSARHFFRSLINGQLPDEGFIVYEEPKTKPLNNSPYLLSHAVNIDSLWNARPLAIDLKYINPKDEVYVVYTKANDETGPVFKPGQLSRIAPEADSVIIDGNGSASAAFLYTGYWAKNNVAELLPLDYKTDSIAEQQKLPLSTASQKIVAAIDSFNKSTPTERVFIHTDKPYYTTNDTIWMKAYVLDGALNYSKQSGLMYAELIDDTGKVVIRQAMPVKYGISFGQVVLDDKTVPEGSYTLRAYTNWMQNQGVQSFFTRQLYISRVSDDAWLISNSVKERKLDGKGNVAMSLLFTKPDKNPVRAREMQLKVTDGDKILNKDNLQTDFNGKLNFNFNLPDKTKDLRVTVQDLRKGEGNRKLIIPVMVNRPENIDLQFMPEGGQLVAGLKTKVGFKAIGEDGRGLDVKGSISDSEGEIVGTFQSLHNGMGSFDMTPQTGENYTAKITLPGGSEKLYPLPKVKASGITLRVDNLQVPDSMVITIKATDDIKNAGGSYMLIAQNGGRVCYAAHVSLDGSNMVRGLIGDDRFITGIVRFTLFTDDKQPLAERIIFVDHHDGLNIRVNTAQQGYRPKDSIALKIHVTNKDSLPVQGSFSIAVTDDSQVKADSANGPGIKSGMLLTSYLQGPVEGPGYYFADTTADALAAMDNLLLTQGWVGYDWNDVFNTKYQPQFKTEQEIAVTGQISRVGNKAVGGLPVMLLSTSKPVLMMTTVSNTDGHFAFKDLPKVDTANFLIQVKDKSGKIFEANVAVDEFTPAKVPALNTIQLTPWYVNSDTTLLNYMDRQRAYNEELDKLKYPAGTRHLKEVVITAKKIIPGSHNLNGPGNADQILDEQDLKNAGKMTLEDMLNKGLIKGFGQGWFPVRQLEEEPLALSDPHSGVHYAYKLFEKKLHFVIDGIDIRFFFQPVSDVPTQYEEMSYYKQYLQQLTAEDIKGIEVLYNNQYNNKYSYAYLERKELDHTHDETDIYNVEYAYLEITTWSGNGAFLKRKHGNYLYRPLPVSWPKQFYRPKYTLKGTNMLADLRPTVYWEPNVVTDAAGNATVWFYAKSKAANYTAIIQGSDLSGSVGQQAKKIIVKN